MENKAKIQPCEYKVLVKPYRKEEKTEGGIVIPESTRTQEQKAEVRGTLVAVGGNAFENWRDPVPEPGHEVYFTKYSGIMVPGEEDEDEYRLINDRDLCGIMIQE